MAATNKTKEAKEWWKGIGSSKRKKYKEKKWPTILKYKKQGKGAPWISKKINLDVKIVRKMLKLPKFQISVLKSEYQEDDESSDDDTDEPSDDDDTLDDLLGTSKKKKKKKKKKSKKSSRKTKKRKRKPVTESSEDEDIGFYENDDISTFSPSSSKVKTEESGDSNYVLHSPVVSTPDCWVQINKTIGAVTISFPNKTNTEYSICPEERVIREKILPITDIQLATALKQDSLKVDVDFKGVKKGDYFSTKMFEYSDHGLNLEMIEKEYLLDSIGFKKLEIIPGSLKKEVGKFYTIYTMQVGSSEEVAEIAEKKTAV